MPAAIVPPPNWQPPGSSNRCCASGAISRPASYWDDAREAALRADCSQQIEAAVQAYQIRPARRHGRDVRSPVRAPTRGPRRAEQTGATFRHRQRTLKNHGHGHAGRRHQSRAGPRARGRSGCRAHRRGHRRQRRRVPRHRGSAAAFRRTAGAGHTAGRRTDRRHGGGHGDAGPEGRRRNPVHGLHLSGARPDRQSHGAACATAPVADSPAPS